MSRAIDTVQSPKNGFKAKYMDWKPDLLPLLVYCVNPTLYIQITSATPQPLVAV
jgi:hypothetical protein